MAVKFAKYEGAGNDFVLIDNRDGFFGALEGMVAALCDRRFGIGADGLMLLENDPDFEFRMRYFNSDGPEATMCGNGGRCLALFAHHLGIGSLHKNFVAVDGPHTAQIMQCEGNEGVVKLRMADVDTIEKRLDGWFLNTGSPHYVEIVDDLAAIDVSGRGRMLRHDDAFAASGGANINFVRLTGPDSFSMRTYERGVEEETLACGTGAVASALAVATAVSQGVQRFRISVPGGDLEVSFEACGVGGFTNVYLTGPARRVFTGEFDTENFLTRSLVI